MTEKEPSRFGKPRAAVICAVVSIMARTAGASAVIGNGTAASCTEASLDKALPGGGLVTFNCGSDAITIRITSTKTISTDTSIDGGGLVTLSGGNAVEMFLVTSDVSFTVENLVIANGQASDGASAIWNNYGTL